MLQHIVFDLGVGCPILKFGHIHIFQRELNPNLFRVDLALGKQDNRLNPGCPRELIHRDTPLHLIAVCDENLQIPRKARRFTGNVYQLLHPITDDSGKCFGMYAIPWRVENDKVRLFFDFIQYL